MIFKTTCFCRKQDILEAAREDETIGLPMWSKKTAVGKFDLDEDTDIYELAEEVGNMNSDFVELTMVVESDGERSSYIAGFPIRQVSDDFVIGTLMSASKYKYFVRTADSELLSEYDSKYIISPLSLAVIKWYGKELPIMNEVDKTDIVGKIHADKDGTRLVIYAGQWCRCDMKLTLDECKEGLEYFSDIVRYLLYGVRGKIKRKGSVCCPQLAIYGIALANADDANETATPDALAFMANILMCGGQEKGGIYMGGGRVATSKGIKRMEAAAGTNPVPGCMVAIDNNKIVNNFGKPCEAARVIGGRVEKHTIVVDRLPATDINVNPSFKEGEVDLVFYENGYAFAYEPINKEL